MEGQRRHGHNYARIIDNETDNFRATERVLFSLTYVAAIVIDKSIVVASSACTPKNGNVYVKPGNENASFCR